MLWTLKIRILEVLLILAVLEEHGVNLPVVQVAEK